MVGIIKYFLYFRITNCAFVQAFRVAYLRAFPSLSDLR